MSVNYVSEQSTPIAVTRSNPRIAAKVIARKTPRVGRPSIANDRRAQIIEAFLECIRRYGLAGATVERVAARLGLSRTLVFHYFGDTEALTRVATEQIFDQTLTRLMTSVRSLPAGKRGQAILDFFFAGPHFGELRDVIVMAEVTSLAGRDKGVHAMLADMWKKSIGIIVDELRTAFPHTDPVRCRTIGYALACLGEENWWLTFIGPGEHHRRDARDAAEILLASLTSATPATAYSTKKHAKQIRGGKSSGR